MSWFLPFAFKISRPWVSLHFRHPGSHEFYLCSKRQARLADAYDSVRWFLQVMIHWLIRPWKSRPRLWRTQAQNWKYHSSTWYYSANHSVSFAQVNTQIHSSHLSLWPIFCFLVAQSITLGPKTPDSSEIEGLWTPTPRINITEPC